VDDQHNWLLRHDGVEPAVDVAGLVDEAVPAVGSRARLAHPDQVRGKAPSPAGQIGDHVAL